MYGFVDALEEDDVTVGLDAGGDGGAVFAPGSMQGLFLTLVEFNANVPTDDRPGYLLFTPSTRGDYDVSVVGGEVPEPSTVFLISSGIALIIVRRRPAFRRN